MPVRQMPTPAEVRLWCRTKYGIDWWKHDKENRRKEAREALSAGELPLPVAPDVPPPTPPSMPSMAQFLSLEKIVKELSIHMAEMSSKLVEQSELIDELQDRLEAVEEPTVENGYTAAAEPDP